VLIAATSPFDAMAPSLLDATDERNTLAGAPVGWYGNF
jgi:hypothetical protein